jgi:pectate lyase
MARPPPRERTRSLRLVRGAAAVGLLGAWAGCGDLDITPIVAPPVKTDPCPIAIAPDGYAATKTAAYPNGTTGGAGGPTVQVSTEADLRAYAGQDGPVIIELTGVLTLTDSVTVASDKTIIGKTKGSGLVNTGFTINKANNVILRNLTVSKAQKPADAVTVQQAQNVWIDHCDLSSDRDHDSTEYYDGLVDITHASDNVTVSWTLFHDHFHVSLVGHSENNAAEDTGHLTVTYHHNWFLRVASQCPRARFGRVHVYNNLYDYDHVRDSEGKYGVASVMDAQTFVENNVFVDVLNPILTTYKDPNPGYAKDTGNYYLDTVAPQLDMLATGGLPYAYTADPISQVPALVKACAGVRDGGF